MSKFLPDAAIIDFDNQVKHAYQPKTEKLRNTVRVKTGVVGESVKFPTMGKGMASKRIAQTDIKPMNISHAKVTCTLDDWEAGEYTDIFDQAEVNYSERAELAMVIAAAINRRIDQIVIDALVAATITQTVSTDIGTASSGLNVKKVLRAGRLLGDAAVPETERTMINSHQGKEDLLAETPVQSSDYNKIKALVNGDVSEFGGFAFKWIETRAEGGLPKAGQVRTGFAYHKTSTGLAIGNGLDKRIDISWENVKASWLAAQRFKGGAVVIDTDGVVEIETTEAA